ncbi:hypothetical protein PPYR_00796, partial [Photinus pyralis]
WLFFSISHNVYGNVSKTQDCKKGISNNDPDFALQLRQLAALAFVPEDHVIASYEELIDNEFYTDNENLLLPLLIMKIGHLWNTYEELRTTFNTKCH